MRKFSANYIFQGDRPPLRNGIILVEDDGTILDLVDTGGDLKEESSLEFYNGIITPGFVNAHAHLELSHLKGLVPEKTGLAEFLRRINRERYFNIEQILQAASEAHTELSLNGTVAVGDICNTSDSFHLKDRNDILYFSFLEVFGLDPEKAGALVRKAEDLAVLIENNTPHSHSIVPHAPYTISDPLFKMLSQHARDKVVSIHNQESEGELRLFREKKGSLYELLMTTGPYIRDWEPGSRNSLAHSMKFLSGARKVLLVHNTFSTTDDIQLANQYGPEIFWVLCPNANLYIEDRLPDVPALTSQDQTIALGTDSLASNRHLSILEEMKTLQFSFPEISLQRCLQWGTLNGARALELDDQLGSIEKGKKPGLNLIYDLDLPGMKLTPGTKVRKLI